MRPLEVEREILLPASPAAIWRALTEGEQISQWFGAEAVIDPRPGGRVLFRFPDGRERAAVVEAFEPERLLILRWLPFERNAIGRIEVRPSTNIRFSLMPLAGGTRLVVRESQPTAFSSHGDGGLGAGQLYGGVRIGRR